MRVLIVGRSPSVLLEAVDILRSRGHHVDATNQFDDVLHDYDVAELDVLLLGGMVPADTKRYLREEVAKANPGVAIVQGLAGMAGLIAAQVDAIAAPDVPAPAGSGVAYDGSRRSVLITLADSAHVTVEVWWGTSFQPPEPRSAHAMVFEGRLEPGQHVIALPDDLPSVASFAATRINDSVHVFTVGEMPAALARLAPTSSAEQRLPAVKAVRTRNERPVTAPSRLPR